MNQRLLIVDDDPNFLELCQFILNPPAFADLGSSAAPSFLVAHFDVVTVSTAEQAISQVETAVASHLPFAGVFLDVHLEGKLSGIETLKRLAECDRDLLFILVTRSREKPFDEVRRLLGPEGARRWDFLSRPFGEEEFLQKACHVVSQWNHKELPEAEAKEPAPVPAETGTAVFGQKLGDLLQSIISQAEKALSTTREPAVRNTLRSLLATCQSAGDLTRGLQKLMPDRAPLQLVPIDTPLREALRLLDAEIKTKKVSTLLEIPADLPSSYMNVAELTEVFLNLILNAIRDTTAKKENEIRVSIQVNTKHAVIKVKNGKGRSCSVILPYRKGE